LDRQSYSDDLLEIMVFDFAADSVPALQMPSRFASKYLRSPVLHFWRVARTQAARESSAPIVAFHEDHCEPHATYAERLLEAHSEGRWAAASSPIRTISWIAWALRLETVYTLRELFNPTRPIVAARGLQASG
jgi:hypothetical protein